MKDDEDCMPEQFFHFQPKPLGLIQCSKPTVIHKLFDVDLCTTVVLWIQWSQSSWNTDKREVPFEFGQAKITGT